ncbi:hypothetical protein OUZ56_030042 [Daphnia magna]|uniref:Uncharacterized protein n=1 Tax=Daphnia magna TaxID=35525 RepID=A0ABQ9ZQ47_9CRUS|nr:hypothetical protein OUZ56_030042 [Daphnia magna]
MKVGPTGLSFTATPTEEGKWYAIKEYQTLNCIAQQITLRQEKPDRPIESPFGLLNTTQQEGQFSQNQNTIVSLEIPRIPESDNTIRLYGTSRQIEISFLNQLDKDIVPIGHKGVGISQTTRRWTLQDVQILFNNPLEDEQLGTGLYSISYAWGTIRLAHRKIAVIKEEGKLVQKILTIYIAYEPESSNSIIGHNQLSKDNPLPSRSEFEYIVKQTIRIQNSNICITETEGDRISAATYSEESTRLILEKENSYLISQELQMWLTLEIDQSLKLEQCAAEENMKKNQQWFFQTINTNPDIVENFPDATLEDIQEVRLEQRKAVKTTMNSPIFGGILKTNHGSGNIIWDMIAWRFLKNGQYPNEKCVTHHGLDEQLTAENCYTDWTKCQDELKTL